MKKKLILFSVVVIAAITLTAIFSIGIAAENTTPELSIDYCNLSYRDTVCIKYAVSSNVDDVKVLIWTEPQTEYTAGTEDATVSTVGSEVIEGVSYKIFDYTKLAAKQMTDVIYARAYTESNGTAYYSEVNKYSVLQYAYNMLGKTAAGSDEADLKALLTDMLTYGASAQKYFGYKTDRPANAEFYQVKVAGGTLEDGSRHGLYLPGDTVKMTAPVTNSEGGTFAYWADSNGNKVGSTAEYTLTVGTKNQEYCPVYVKYSSGLEIEEDDRAGEAYVVGLGTCTDTDLVIPSLSDSGYPITEIDRYAFENVTTITSVSLPNMITVIGRYAFDGCTSLTDVYYDGTEEEWNNNVDLESGNDVIEAAAKHFNDPAVVTYTVTFVDYNGTVLKTETVEEGKGATAPADPERSGYTFIGWDKAFDNVTGNLTVTAQYNEPSKFFVSTTTTSAGTTDVVVTVSIENNPGILGMVLKLNYDDSVLTLTKATKGAALYSHSLTKPGQFVDGCKFVIDTMELEEEDYEDGVILTLKFNVSSSALVGSYDIEISYETDAIKDSNYAPINNIVVENGEIIVK